MSDQANRDNLYYVAPAEPLPSRRPPITEVGLLKWLRENLFKTTSDSVMTIVTGVLLLLGMGSFLNWAIFQAQWEVAFLNLRPLNVGAQFPIDQVWRTDAIAMIVIFLALMSVAMWGRMARVALIALVLIAVLMIVLPPLTAGVPEPPVHFWVESGYNFRQANILLQEGQQINFAVDPLTDDEDFLIVNVQGYVENDNRGSNTSFDSFAAAGTDVTFLDTRDPSVYDLNVVAVILDDAGEEVFRSAATDASPSTTEFEWEAPAAGWYTVTAELAEDSGENGAAWLVVDGVNVLSSTVRAIDARQAEYGPPPEADCNGCGTTIYRTDLRFQGSRTLAQWFSTQLTPFLVESRAFFFLALLVGAAGFGVGWGSLHLHLKSLQPLVATLRRPLYRASMVLFAVYIGIQLLSPLLPVELLNTIYTPVLLLFCGAVILWAVSLLLSNEEGTNSRGLTILWLISFPIISLLLTGVSGSQLLPVLNTAQYGGLLLTLLLSAVAIGFSMPLGLFLALGRQSPLPVVRVLCTVFIEVLRGVPLITLLFMGRLILPFFGFGLGDVDLVIRTMVMMTFFTSAYMAEVIRGGLQIIPRGQVEAAAALGLNDFYTTTFIVLPQAIRAVIPAIMGQAVSLYKDTSLVFIIGLFEVLGVMNKVILADSQTGYTQFSREGYLYVGIVYFVFSYIMADVSRRLERTGSGAVRRDTV